MTFNSTDPKMINLVTVSDFFNDGNGFYWHQRILLNTDGQGRWTVVTPTSQVQLADLGVGRTKNEAASGPQPEFVGGHFILFGS